MAPLGLGCPSHLSWCQAGIRLWEQHPPSRPTPALHVRVPLRVGLLLLCAGWTPLLYNPGCDCGERLI